MEQIEAFGRYGGSLRHLALRMKDGNPSALRRAAELMASRIPAGAVVVPMPSHRGRATTMLAVAECIGRTRPDVSVCDALEAEPHASSYAAKKAGRRPEAIRMRLRQPVPHGRVFIIDNCVDTGATFRAACAAIPDATLLVLATTGRETGMRKKKRQKVWAFVVVDKNSDNPKYDGCVSVHRTERSAREWRHRLRDHQPQPPAQERARLVQRPHDIRHHGGDGQRGLT